MKKPFIISIFLAVALIVLGSWGSTGHSKINECASYSFNQQMADFQGWINYLSGHASDADYRKDSDPDEAPRHYIDIDGYPEFVATGHIQQNFDSVIRQHGYTFVEGKGILPWATLAAFDSLCNCFARGDASKARQWAADLGHYVADGHMPLHITENYNGQLTGNTGIHSRYESSMINAYITQIIYQGSDISAIPDVRQYVFDYIYTNHTYVDSVLAADNYAQTQSQSTSSSAYKQALWSKSKGFTIKLFSNASHALAELIHTAWVQAGMPDLSTLDVEEKISAEVSLQVRSVPNPFSASTQIQLHVKQPSDILIQVRDIHGSLISTMADRTFEAGTHALVWAPLNKPAGVYYLFIETGGNRIVKKIIYLGN